MSLQEMSACSMEAITSLILTRGGGAGGGIKKHHEAVPLINVSYGQFSLLKRAVGSMYLAGHSAVPCKNTQQERE